MMIRPGMSEEEWAGMSEDERAEYLECEAEHVEDMREVAAREARIEAGWPDEAEEALEAGPEEIAARETLAQSALDHGWPG
jgi:hypothetical protein